MALPPEPLPVNHVSLAAVEPDGDRSGVERRRLSGSLGTTALAVTHYRIAPGEGLPSGLHAHADQEEVFNVRSGTATFEYLPPVDADGHAPGESTVSVAAGEAVRFAPGEFQSGHNAGSDPLDLLAVGAPRDSTDLRFPVDCPRGDAREMRLVADDGPRFVCPECGVERTPVPCPDCGGGDLRVTLGETTRTVVVCADCEATFDVPPTREDW